MNVMFPPNHNINIASQHIQLVFGGVFHLYRDSSLDDDNSGESPLISIWGDYTGQYHWVHTGFS